MTQAQALDKAVNDYLAGLDPANPPALNIVEPEILRRVHDEFDIHNAVCQRDARWKKPNYLEPRQIGLVLLKLRNIRTISFCGEGFSKDSSNDLLGLYQDNGPEEGLYSTSESVIKNLIREVSPYMRWYNMNELLDWLRLNAPYVSRCDDPNLVPVANGIFDYKAKKLLPFSPDYVFLTKSPITYHAGLVSPVIHNNEDGTDWDPESWMASLSDDPEIVDILWKIIGACIRNNVKWNKAAWLYSRSGNNGKGTLCSLIRDLVGTGNCVSISIDAFCNGGDFILEPLLHASAVIVDENNVGAYIDKSSDLKAVITGDVIQVNRKYRASIPYQFHGFMIQCLNDYPRIKDRTGSFARRQLIVPMEKCFTGSERKYIKHDYLKRPEVLRYFLYRVLNMCYDELEAPKACRDALVDYREANDSLIQFIEDIFDKLTWEVVPFTFLYALYKAWMTRMNPSGMHALPSARSFQDDLVDILDSIPTGYACPGGKRVKHRFPKKDIGIPEPLIAEYGLIEWMNPIYKGNDLLKKCVPAPGMIPDTVRGIRRTGTTDEP